MNDFRHADGDVHTPIDMALFLCNGLMSFNPTGWRNVVPMTVSCEAVCEELGAMGKGLKRALNGDELSRRLDEPTLEHAGRDAHLF